MLAEPHCARGRHRGSTDGLITFSSHSRNDEGMSRRSQRVELDSVRESKFNVEGEGIGREVAKLLRGPPTNDT